MREVIEPGQQGVLVDFFDVEGLAARVDELLQDPERRARLSQRARATILERGYDLPTCLQRQIDLIEQLMTPA